MAVDKIDTKKAESTFYSAAAITQRVHDAAKDEATRLQATAMNNYFSAIYQVLHQQSKALNDTMERLERIEQLVNKTGMITTLR